MRFNEQLKQDLLSKAIKLRGAGLSYKQIGEKLDISHATAHRWLSENAMSKHIEYNRAYGRRRHHENPEESRARCRQYYYNNKEKIKIRQSKNYLKSRDRRLDYSRNYRKNNKSVIKEWSKRNHERLREYCARRRASRLRATPEWLSKEHKKEIEKLHAEAIRLTELTGEQYEVDHVHPLKHKLLCGLHVPWNMRVMSSSDNRKKSNIFDPSLGLTAW